MLQDYFKRYWIRILVSLLILTLFIAHVARWVDLGLVDRLEKFAYDARLVMTMPKTVDPRVVIVEIDERSLAAEGRWPWGRDKIAKLVEQLFNQYGASLVGFDVVFAESDDSEGIRVLDTLARSEIGSSPAFRRQAAALRPSLNRDAILAGTLSQYPVVLGVFFSGGRIDGEALEIGALPTPIFRSGQFTGRNIPFIVALGYSGNLSVLQENALAAGHLSSVPDADGLVRRVPMIYEYGGNYYESLSLAVARIALGAERVGLGYPTESRAGRSYSGLEWLDVGGRRVPVDEGVRALVPFRGPEGSFPYVSATDVLRGTADAAMLRDKIVLVGATAEGLLDLRATPVQVNYPGVEMHANLITGILDETIKENPAYVLGGEFLLVLVTGLVLALGLPVLRPVWAAVLTIGMLAGIIGLNVWIWSTAGFVFPLAASVLSILSLFLFNVWYAYFFEERGKRHLAGLFGEYVPPELVEEMNDHPDSFSLASENRELTVLFSDVRGFTTLSEGMEPNELSNLMNEFLTPMTRVIYDHRGTIDKYMGDAIMAFWGAPVHDPDHASHALEAALAMVGALGEVRKHFASKGWPPLDIGIGINTGNMNVGNMGSAYRRAYTVLGDPVNIGSRLEGLTKQYGVSIILSEQTRDEAPEFAYRELDLVRVKGKDAPLKIYELLGRRDQVDQALRDELKLYREALKLYRARNWDMAEIQFVNLLRRAPDRVLYKEYAKRVQRFRKQPPPSEWDGVFTHLTK